MCTPILYACNLYTRAWGSSSIDVESCPKGGYYTREEYKQNSEQAKWLVDCLKWSVRAATLGVFSCIALYAASSLGASALTVQILTYSTCALFGVSGAALVAPFAKHIFLGAFAGAVLVGVGYSQLPFPLRIMARPFLEPALAIGAGIGIIGWNFANGLTPLHQRPFIRYTCEELSKDYEAYKSIHKVP